jgi:hypothetical protein
MYGAIVKVIAVLVVIGLASVGGYRLLNHSGDALAEDLVSVLNQPVMQEQYGLSAAAKEAECNDDRTFEVLGHDWHDCTATFVDGTARPFCVMSQEPSAGVDGRTCAQVRRDLEDAQPGSTSD